MLLLVTASLASVSDVTKPVKVGNRRSHADGRRERWNEHRQERRAEFVAAAVRAISAHGADVGMDEIAAEAGVSKPVLYRHFSDKGDLHTAVAASATQQLLDLLVPVIAEGGSPHQRIRRIVDTYIGFIEKNPDLYRFVVHRRFADRPIGDDPVAEDKATIANSLSRLIGEYTRMFGLDSGGVEAWSHGLVGMVQASGEWWLERQSMSRDNLTDYLTEIIWYAIDGVLRGGGITLDPNAPIDPAISIDAVPPLRAVPDTARANDPQPG